MFINLLSWQYSETSIIGSHNSDLQFFLFAETFYSYYNTINNFIMPPKSHIANPMETGYWEKNSVTYMVI